MNNRCHRHLRALTLGQEIEDSRFKPAMRHSYSATVRPTQADSGRDKGADVLTLKRLSERSGGKGLKKESRAGRGEAWFL